MDKSSFKKNESRVEQIIKDYPNAFRDNRTELYKAATLFFNCFSFTLLSINVLVLMIVLNYLIAWFS